MVEYLSGNRIQGSSTKVSSPPQTSWKLLKRHSLPSANSTISSGTFTTKENLMVLHYDAGRNADSSSCGMRFNNDTNQNYTSRSSSGGGSDNNGYDDKDHIVNMRTSTNNEIFAVSDILNLPDKEKLVITTKVQNKASSSPFVHGSHAVGKWVRTSGSGTGDSSTSITSVQSYTGSSDTFASGSEIVVLGCNNDESDSGTNFWEQLVDETSQTTGDFSVTFTPKKYLWVQCSGEADGNNRTSFRLQYGTSSSAFGSGTYKFVTADEGGDGSDESHGDSYVSFADTLGASGQSGNSGNTQVFTDTYIVNVADKMKLAFHRSTTNQPDTQGSSATMDRRVTKSRWDNASEQINQIKVIASGDTFPAGTRITVWGAD